MERLYLSDLIRILRRKWYVLLLSIFLSLAGAWAFYEYAPKFYESSAVLRIESQRGEGVFQSVSGVAILMGGPSKDVASHIEMMKSRGVLEKVILDSGFLDHIEKGEGESHTRLLERALRILRKELQIDPIPNTNLVRISYRSDDSELAFKIVDSVVRTYSEFVDDLMKKSVNLEKEFLEAQLKLLEEKMRKSLEEFSNYKKSTGIFSIEDELASLVEKLKEVETELEKSRVLISELEKEIERDRESLEKAPEPVDRELVVSIEQSILLMESKLAGYKAKYPSNHPEITALEREIGELRSKLENLRESENADLLDKQFLKEKLLKKISMKSELERNTVELEKIKDMILKRMNYLADHEIEYVNLKGKYSMLMDVYNFLSRRYEETMLKEAATISPITLIESPIVSEIPVWPSKTITYAVGMALGILLGVILSVLSVVTSSRISDGILAIREFGLKNYHFVRKGKRSRRDIEELSLKLKDERGILCVIGCCDGEGKSTIAKGLYEWFSRMGSKVKFIRVENMEDLPIDLKRDEGTILIDTPSIDENPIAYSLLGKVDSFLVVIGEGISTKSGVEKILRDFKPRFVVLNKVRWVR